MNNAKIGRGEIYQNEEDDFNRTLARYGNRVISQELFELLCFIESLEKEPKGKTNPLFEECLANVDPAVRKEVHENIDKMLEEEKSGIPTIKGWVARDDFGLMFYRRKPRRVVGEVSHWTDELGPNSEWILNKELFPNLKWEDEPIEVELTITPIKNS